MVLNLFNMFVKANQFAAARAQAYFEPHASVGLLSPEAYASLNDDPFPYGIKANRDALQTFCRYSFEQGLSKRLVELEEVFAPATFEF